MMYEYFHFCLIFCGFLFVLKLFVQKVVRSKTDDDGYIEEGEATISDHESIEMQDTSELILRMDPNETAPNEDASQMNDFKKRMSRFSSMMYL